MNSTNLYGFKDETQYGKAPVALMDLRKPIDEKLDVRAVSILANAKAFKIQNRDDYKIADDILSEGAALIKGIKLIHDPICAATNTAHVTATGTRKKLIDPVEQACKIFQTLMGNYKLVENRRIAEEQKAKEEIARNEQEEAALNQAAQMEKEGAPLEAVEAVLSMADEPVQITQPVDELRSKNSITPSWDIEVLDKVLVPDYYKTVNKGAIRTAVKLAKGNITIPGVRVFDTFKTRRKAL